MNSEEAKLMLFSVGLPEKTDSYTPIAHHVIDYKTRHIIKDMGFTINSITYNSSSDGQVGQCQYNINYGDDPDLGLMVVWQNSYNKLVSFKYAVGTYVMVCGNGCVVGDLGAYKRKHTGTADEESYEIIKSFLSQSKIIYENFIADRDILMKIDITPEEMAGYMGKMFIHDQIITSTQLNIMKRELENPTYHYGVSKYNAWSLYNFATFAFKEDSPRTWLKRHIDLHNFFNIHFISKRAYPLTPEKVFIEKSLFIDVSEEKYEKESPFITNSIEEQFETFEYPVEELETEKSDLRKALDKLFEENDFGYPIPVEDAKVEEKKVTTNIDILDDF